MKTLIFDFPSEIVVQRARLSRGNPGEIEGPHMVTSRWGHHQRFRVFRVSRAFHDVSETRKTTKFLAMTPSNENDMK